MPHRLNVNGTFVLPVGAGHKWLTERTWQRAARRLVGHHGRALPERLPGQRLAVHATTPGCSAARSAPTSCPASSWRRSGSLEERLTNWINPAAFTAAPAYTFGNAPRTLPDLRTPGQRNVDLSVQKTQCVRRGKTISVRADVLNLFDNPLFTTLQSQFGTPTFGQLTAVGGYARSVQFQVRVGF